MAQLNFLEYVWFIAFLLNSQPSHKYRRIDMGKVSLMRPASSVPSPTLRCYSPHPSETLRFSNVPPTNSRMFHSSPFMRNHQRGHSSKNKYVAIKILSGSATQLNHEHKLRELEVPASVFHTFTATRSLRSPCDSFLPKRQWRASLLGNGLVPCQCRGGS